MQDLCPFGQQTAGDDAIIGRDVVVAGREPAYGTFAETEHGVGTVNAIHVLEPVNAAEPHRGRAIGRGPEGAIKN